MEVKVKCLNERAKLPAYATPGAAAADLCAAMEEPLALKPGQRALVPTGLAIELPGPGYVALIFARSGLAVKRGLALSNGVGVVDSDYRGEVKVGIVNQGDEDYTIRPGERIAQLMVAPVALADFLPCEELGGTGRGEGGFGSTGRGALGGQ